MTHPALSGIREKIKWADKHIDDFKVAAAEFTNSKPYSLRVDTETESGKPLVQMLEVRNIPPEISLTVGDAIQNLRSALDYLACGLVDANKGVIGRWTEFPIFDGPIVTSRDKARFSGKVEGMRQEAIDDIRDLHPYQGGDNLLWRLHRLNIVGKHKMLVTAWGSITAINGLPPIEDQWNGNRWLGIRGVPLTLKQGDKFSLDAPGVKIDKNTTFFAEIVFNEPNVAEGYPIVLALSQFRRRVIEVVGMLSLYLR
jgi:hypothetical protein